MTITQLCNSRRDALLPRWAQGFFASYPLDGAGFLRSNNDPFLNPVGDITRRSLAVLYDAVAGNDMEPEAVRAALEDLVRLRAVQDMAPSKAVGAFYLLKDLLRESVLGPWISGQASGQTSGQTSGKTSGQAAHTAERLAEYLALEGRLDSLALMAFDIYAGDREKVFRLRVEEVKRGQSQVVRWAARRGEAPLPNCNTEG